MSVVLQQVAVSECGPYSLYTAESSEIESSDRC